MENFNLTDAELDVTDALCDVLANHKIDAERGELILAHLIGVSLARFDRGKDAGAWMAELTGVMMRVALGARAIDALTHLVKQEAAGNG